MTTNIEPARIIVVVGTRPEAIKLAPVITKLDQSPLFTPYVINTGQHPTMTADTLTAFNVTVNCTIALPAHHGNLNTLTGALLGELNTEFLRLTTNDTTTTVVVVHGDTTTAMAAALAARHTHLPVVHIEAGLRTGNTSSPFPEELNRQIIARLTSFHLAPTTTAAANLIAENVDPAQIFITGNTGIDAFLAAAATHTPFTNPALEDLVDSGRRYIVLTAHRRENWGQPLVNIATAASRLADADPDLAIVIPVHPNPAVADIITTTTAAHTNIFTVDPLPVHQMARLISGATLVITDSGGIQEEAPAANIPVLVTRTHTERQEGVDTGALQCVGTDINTIVDVATELLTNPARHQMMAEADNPYGDGYASARIVAALDNLLFAGPTPSPYRSAYNRLAVLADMNHNTDPAHQVNPDASALTYRNTYVGPERRTQRSAD